MSDLSAEEKFILEELYLNSLVSCRNDSFQIEISRIDAIDPESSKRKEQLERLESNGLITHTSDDYILTPNARSQLTVVLAGGSFDIIHPGHLETLEKSKALGDILVVSIARDSTFENNKRRKPLHNEKQRRKLVLALKCVDAAILGSHVDILETLLLVRPDIVALGYDQFHSEAKILEGAKARGLNVKVVRLDSSVPSIKTAKIVSEQKSA